MDAMTQPTHRLPQAGMPISISRVDPFPRDPTQSLWWGRDAWWASGIPENLRRQIQIDGWDAIDRRGGELEAALRGAWRFAQWPWSAGLYLCGPVGCGKSLIAALTLREMILRAKHVGEQRGDWGPGGHIEFWYPTLRFINMPHLLSEIKGTFGRQSAYEPSTHGVLNQYLESDVLVLDDIGAENQTEWSRSFQFELVDSRYGGQRPTIFTSNLTLDELSVRISERVADRIAEMCAGFIFLIKTTSYRLLQASKGGVRC